MTAQPPKIYDHLHFREYLDGGSEKMDSLNWNALQKDLPTTTSFHFDHQTPDTKIYKTRGSFKDDGRTLAEAYAPICQQLLHQNIARIEFPGGPQRSSFRVILESGRSVIATRRFHPSRSLFESLLMRRLEAHNAPIPQHYAYNGLVLFQEDLPGTRLSTALETANTGQYLYWMSQAMDALLKTHTIARQEELAHAIPVIGCDPDWLIALIDRTALLGNYAGIPCPAVSVSNLYDRLILLKPCFTKWDARPGNAMLSEDGRVKWFDWEHACARNPIDDMVWLLCDDAAPDYPEAEEQLIDNYLVKFADGRDDQGARDYLSVFGVHHTCVRIARLLDEKGKDSWKEYEQRANVRPMTLTNTAQRLCTRGARWAAKHKDTAILHDWLLEVSERLVVL